MELSKVTAIVRTSMLETVEKRLQELRALNRNAGRCARAVPWLRGISSSGGD
jgi:hypothetical protein